MEGSKRARVDRTQMQRPSRGRGGDSDSGDGDVTPDVSFVCERRQEGFAFIEMPMNEPESESVERPPHLKRDRQWSFDASRSDSDVRLRPSTMETTKSTPHSELTLDSGSSTQNSLQSLHSEHDEKPLVLMNYGSEEEEEGDEDEDMSMPFIIPRSVRSAFKTELNEESVKKSTKLDQDQLVDWCLPTVEKELAPPKSTSARSIQPSLHKDQGTNSSVYKPTQFLDFQWRAFSYSDNPPHMRRETFKEHPGPLRQYANPYDAFTAIWDRQIMAKICDQTNLYVQQMTEHLLSTGKLYPKSRITQWKDIDIDELYVYFAIVLAMGLVIKSRIEDYWSNKQDIFTTTGFTTYMSINRFLVISRWLHFINNQDMHNLQLTRAQAKLFKVQPIIDHLNNKFCTLYSLSQNIALDESLMQWQYNYNNVNQIISKKGAGVRMKTYEICDTRNGYLWRFEIHTGIEPSQNSDPVTGDISSTVLRLLQGLEFKGHTLWMDDEYNSPALARRLKSMQIDCAGTLRTNVQTVPVQLATLKKSQMIKGQIVGCTSGDVDLLVWRDLNAMAFISTYHGVATTRLGDYLQPTLVRDYNMCMMGIDKKDQVLASYPIERSRNKIWYKSLFKRLLNLSVYNSFMMYKTNLRKLSHREFRINLVRQLLAHHHQQRPVIASLISISNQEPPKFSAEVLKHFPAEYGLLSGGKSRIRRKCVICKERTFTYCPGCNVALCTLKKYYSELSFSCYRNHHS